MNRDRFVGKVEAFGRRRNDLIRALDATFPADQKIAVKDIKAADPTKSWVTSASAAFRARPASTPASINASATMNR